MCKLGQNKISTESREKGIKNNKWINKKLILLLISLMLNQ